MQNRKFNITRETRETKITAALNLDGAGLYEISTGIGFLDHMLSSFTVHGNFNLTLECKGDLEVDGHHTAEDIGIVLGSAVRGALAESKIIRFGSARIPMDESLGWCDLDICGRPYLVFAAEFAGEKVGELDTALVREFMKSFAFNAGITLHIGADCACNVCEGVGNDHHKIEAMFKSLAYALKQAVAENPDGKIISAKGCL
ncbi:MAG: imidazoleglycerol-phosphate dehydratase HisB [Oscillospiraceae bacterium]|nr:imidazoleglycerol-phosphate dehydratase HisB [Oscillospiraceae bacterium]